MARTHHRAWCRFRGPPSARSRDLWSDGPLLRCHAGVAASLAWYPTCWSHFSRWAVLQVAERPRLVALRSCRANGRARRKPARIGRDAGGASSARQGSRLRQEYGSEQRSGKKGEVWKKKGNILQIPSHSHSQSHSHSHSHLLSLSLSFFCCQTLSRSPSAFHFHSHIPCHIDSSSQSETHSRPYVDFHFQFHMHPHPRSQLQSHFHAESHSHSGYHFPFHSHSQSESSRAHKPSHSLFALSVSFPFSLLVAFALSP